MVQMLSVDIFMVNGSIFDWVPYLNKTAGEHTALFKRLKPGCFCESRAERGSHKNNCG
jgi:hypothetical protein